MIWAALSTRTGRAVAGLVAVLAVVGAIWAAGVREGRQDVQDKLNEGHKEGAQDATDAIGDVERDGAVEWLHRTFGGPRDGNP